MHLAWESWILPTDLITSREADVREILHSAVLRYVRSLTRSDVKFIATTGYYRVMRRGGQPMYTAVEILQKTRNEWHRSAYKISEQAVIFGYIKMPIDDLTAAADLGFLEHMLPKEFMTSVSSYAALLALGRQLRADNDLHAQLSMLLE